MLTRINKRRQERETLRGKYVRPSPLNKKFNKVIQVGFTSSCVNKASDDSYTDSDSENYQSDPNNDGLDDNNRQLAKRYAKKEAAFIARQEDKTFKIIEKSEKVLSKAGAEYSEKSNQQSTTPEKKVTKELFLETVNGEREDAEYKIKYLRSSRDDVLDLIDTRDIPDNGSDYEENFRPQSEIDKYNNLDAYDWNILRAYNTTVETVKSIFYGKTNQSDTEWETEYDSNSAENTVSDLDSSSVSGKSESLDERAGESATDSLKRERSNSVSDSPNSSQKIKQDMTTTEEDANPLKRKRSEQNEEKMEPNKVFKQDSSDISKSDFDPSEL
jgi:hypothetical protein